MDVENFLCGFHGLGEIPADKVWLFEINGFPCETTRHTKIVQANNKSISKVNKQHTQDVNLDSRCSEKFLFHNMKKELSTASE